MKIENNSSNNDNNQIDTFTNEEQSFINLDEIGDNIKYRLIKRIGRGALLFTFIWLIFGFFQDSKLLYFVVLAVSGGITIACFTYSISSTIDNAKDDNVKTYNRPKYKLIYFIIALILYIIMLIIKYFK